MVTRGWRYPPATRRRKLSQFGGIRYWPTVRTADRAVPVHLRRFVAVNYVIDAAPDVWASAGEGGMGVDMPTPCSEKSSDSRKDVGRPRCSVLARQSCGRVDGLLPKLLNAPTRQGFGEVAR